jgi:hypothetical protein
MGFALKGFVLALAGVGAATIGYLGYKKVQAMKETKDAVIEPAVPTKSA